jgi:histone H3/H4
MNNRAIKQTPNKLSQKNKHSHQTKGCLKTPLELKHMPRKTKLQVNPIDSVAVEESMEPTTESQPAASAPEIPTTEVEVETTEAVARRPRKKLRRPILSDTVSAIPVAAFQRLVREISADCKSDLRWEGEALKALQVDTEAYLIGKFQKAKETLNLFGCKTLGDKMLKA